MLRATARAHCTAAVPLSYAQPFAFSISSLEIDYSPRLLWRPQRGEHVMESRLMAHAPYVRRGGHLREGQLRAAKAFAHQTAALRWADEQRVTNTDAAC